MTAAERAAALRHAVAAMRRAEKLTAAAIEECQMVAAKLTDADRRPQVVAVEMICSSLEQSARDLNRWQTIVLADRAEDRG